MNVSGYKNTLSKLRKQNTSFSSGKVYAGAVLELGDVERKGTVRKSVL